MGLATTTPAVTVVTPTKNRLRLLCETMESVRAQGFDSWEHVIVDDGSDDGTADELARRAAAISGFDTFAVRRNREAPMCAAEPLRSNRFLGLR